MQAKYSGFTFIALLLLVNLHAQNFISEKKEAGAFPVVAGNSATTIYTDASDDWLVQKAALLLQEDMEKVSGKKPALATTLPAKANNIIVIGTLDKSALLKQLVQQKKLNIVNKGKWDGYTIQVISNPFKGIDNALVIAGNNKRGAAYGVFELSEQMGVSPWYWWGDVPVKKKKKIYVKKGIAKTDFPSVKYRGIFI